MLLRRMRCSGGCGRRANAAWLVAGPVLKTRASDVTGGACGRRRGNEERAVQVGRLLLVFAVPDRVRLRSPL
jgi:hypothetical protein